MYVYSTHIHIYIYDYYVQLKSNIHVYICKRESTTATTKRNNLYANNVTLLFGSLHAGNDNNHNSNHHTYIIYIYSKMNKD